MFVLHRRVEGRTSDGYEIEALIGRQAIVPELDGYDENGYLIRTRQEHVTVTHVRVTRDGIRVPLQKEIDICTQFFNGNICLITDLDEGAK